MLWLWILCLFFTLWITKHQATGRDRGQQSWKELLSGAGGRQLISWSKSRWLQVQKNRQKLPPPEGLSWRSLKSWSWDGQLFMSRSKLGVSRAWMSYVSRESIGSFSNIRPWIYFKDFVGKGSQKGIRTDWWIPTQSDGHGEAHAAWWPHWVAGSGSAPSWRLARLCVCVHPPLWCGASPPCGCGNDAMWMSLGTEWMYGLWELFMN